MKALRILLILAVTVAALGFSMAPAKAGYFTYTSGIQVQNLEGTQAKITVTFYNQDGTVNNSVSDTIAANDDVTYFPLNQVGDGFNGSVVISSDKQVAAISNVVGDNFSATASYIAASSGAKKILIPLLMKNNRGYNTWFNVQNTGGAEANVTVNYSDGTSRTAKIKPGAAFTFDQNTETHSVAVFSAIVTSDQDIAATVIEESPKIMFAYSGFNAGTINPVMPLINANNSGYQTGIQIQNAGTSATNVTVSYTPSKDGNGNPIGTACTETQSIPAGQSKTFALNAFAGAPLDGMTTNCAAKVKFVGSAKVTTNSASQELVAIINQLGASNGEAYGSFDASAATGKVVLPLIMDRNSGFYTGFSLMNVGGAAASVTCNFAGSSYSFTKNLQPNEAYADIQNGKIANGYVGSATCTTSGSIVAVVNELKSSSADLLMVYEGVSVTP